MDGNHGLHPMSGILNGLEAICQYTVHQPHLYFYLLPFGYQYLARVSRQLALFQSLFSLVRIILFYRLAHFYVRGLALWLTALFILGPAFLVQQNLMVDVPSSPSGFASSIC